MWSAGARRLTWRPGSPLPARFIGYEPVTHHSEPGGEGESGDNAAVYVYQPDGHYVEFFHVLDTRDSY
jgi:hypothetical protein